MPLKITILLCLVFNYVCYGQKPVIGKKDTVKTTKGEITILPKSEKTINYPKGEQHFILKTDSILLNDPNAILTSPEQYPEFPGGMKSFYN